MSNPPRLCCSFLGTALVLGLCGSASATAQGRAGGQAAGLPVAVSSLPGMVVAARDQAGRLGPAPSVVVDGTALPLLDDGRGPDLAAADGIFTALQAGLVGPAMVGLAVLATDGSVQWQDQIPVGPGVTRPVVRVAFVGDRVAVDLATRGRGSAPPPAPEATGAKAGGAQAGVPIVPIVRPSAQNPAFVSGAVAIQATVGLLGLAMGLWAGLMLAARRRGPRLLPVSAPPHQAGTVRLLRLSVPLGAAVLADLPGRQAAQTLLVAAGPAHVDRSGEVRGDGPRGDGAVCRLADRPTVSQVIEAAALLASWGPVLVLVEGALSLAASAADDPAGAVLASLCERVPAGVALVVLLSPEEAVPASLQARVESIDQPQPDELWAGQQPVLRQKRGRWAWVSAPAQLVTQTATQTVTLWCGAVLLPGLGAGLGLGLVLAGTGCHRRAGLADCAAQPSGQAQEDCRLQTLLGQPLASVQAGIAEVDSASSRDLLRVRLVVSDPHRYGVLCVDVRHAGSRDWCNEVLDRPHLELGGSELGGSGLGGPP